MASRTKYVIIGVLIFIVLVTAGVSLYLDTRARKITKEEEVVPAAQYQPKPVPRQETFTKTAFVLPRESNTKPGVSIYSPVAQIRGTVQYYSKDQVVVDVAGEPVFVTLTVQTRLFCVPLEIDRGDGQKISSKEVFSDLYRVGDKGKPATPAQIAKAIPGGQDINILVDVAAKDEFVARTVMGYGCSL